MFIFLTTYKNDFEKRKERYIFAFSILHEQTTANARSKLVG